MTSPSRIVSLISSATEILYLLGLGDRVVGVSHECDFPPDACTKPRLTRSNVDSTVGSRSIDEQVKSLLVGGLPLYEMDASRLVALKPDLIITQAQCDVCAIRYEDVAALVRDQPSLRDVPLVALNPRSLSDVLTDIQNVADLAGASAIGQRVVGEFSARVSKVQNKSGLLAFGELPRVACIEWTDPLMLAGNWMPELVRFAGGRHDLTQAGIHSGYSSWDALIGYNPQVIMVMPCGFGLGRSVTEAAALAERTEWADLEAVRTGRVFAVGANAYFNRSGPRLVETLELLAHLIHPNLFDLPTLSLSPAYQSCLTQGGLT